MPGSQPPSDGPRPLRIAPHLDLEQTKLTATDSAGEPITIRDPSGHRTAEPGSPTATPPPRRIEIPRYDPLPEPPSHRFLWLLALAAGALVAVLVIRELQGEVSRPAGWEAAEAQGTGGFVPATAAPGEVFDPVKERTQRKIDNLGRTTRVLAENPLSVLRAYCAAAEDGETRVPVGLSDALPRRPDVRMGLFSNDRGETLAIRIRLERGGQRWFTGDGRNPVTPEIPPVTLTRR